MEIGEAEADVRDPYAAPHRAPCAWDGDSPSGGCVARFTFSLLADARVAFDGKYILMATTDTALGNIGLNMQVNQ